MPEYIEREGLEEDIKQYSHARIDNDAIDKMGFQFVEEMISILRIIEKQPAADVVEVKHGEWKWGYQNGQYGIWCTNCGAGWVNSENAEWIAHEHDYCPKCGAKMDKKEGDEE